MSFTDTDIIKAFESPEPFTATKIAAKLNMQYSTLKKHAIRLGVWKTNQSGKGLSKTKTEGNGKYPLSEILEGKHPYYQTNKLKLRLLKEKIKPHRCEICLLNKWNGEKIPLECDHIDGNSKNHILSNLRILCPNCHAQTSTYRGKNKNKHLGT